MRNQENMQRRPTEKEKMALQRQKMGDDDMQTNKFCSCCDRLDPRSCMERKLFKFKPKKNHFYRQSFECNRFCARFLPFAFQTKTTYKCFKGYIRFNTVGSMKIGTHEYKHGTNTVCITHKQSIKETTRISINKQ